MALLTVGMKSPLASGYEPDFDAGLNSSNAWKKHLSISDAGPPSDDDASVEEKPILARATRDVAGNEDNREMALKAGDNIEIINSDIGDSWSLARKSSGDMGLIPKDCYVTTQDFASNLPPQLPQLTSSQLSNAPIRMQSTGESILASSLNNLRQSVLGGKSLNRFSHFVTTGAEDWVLNGYQPPADTPTTGHSRYASDATIDGSDHLAASRITEADRHYVETGPAWKQKSPPFRILVHSPSKQSSVTGAYTLYSVTSIFQSSSPSPTPPSIPYLRPDLSSNSTRITVHRRFSHFAFLHTALTRKLPGIALPPLPAKQYAGRFQGEFVEARRNDLERWLSRVVRHPVARYSEVLTFFLGCESDMEWKRLLPQHLQTLPAGPTFYAHVFHPEFNLDADDCLAVVDRFERHVKLVDGRIDVLRSVMGGFREARNSMSNAQRMLSLAFLSLISENRNTNAEGETEVDSAYLNDESAWCWHDGCEDCLQMTKTLQKMSDCMQLVADLHEDSARRSLLGVHEIIKDASHPSVIYTPVIETHRATLSRYKEHDDEGPTTSPRPDAPEIASRCETVLNTTMAEFDTYHAQRGEDFTQIAVEYLDSEIEFYEQVLQKLKAARAAFTPEGAQDLPSGPRQKSMYEKNIRMAPQSPPLPQPTSHIYDPAPIRPVSTAVRESVGMLIDGLSNSAIRDKDGDGRSTMLKFWS
ncbi:sorting nexin lst-4 [Ceratobasidium sp. AG-Ba]|nr:sorting nexin lst-4 [Ceratobasidium sp. AG-Ba]QRW04689.1 sorting nexin lst-4 [Ceratobasidium sp. AG-Ba]